jgi:hypothetical protein
MDEERMKRHRALAWCKEEILDDDFTLQSVISRASTRERALRERIVIEEVAIFSKGEALLADYRAELRNLANRGAVTRKGGRERRLPIAAGCRPER